MKSNFYYLIFLMFFISTSKNLNSVIDTNIKAISYNLLNNNNCSQQIQKEIAKKICEENADILFIQGFAANKTPWTDFLIRSSYSFVNAKEPHVSTLIAFKKDRFLLLENHSFAINFDSSYPDLAIAYVKDRMSNERFTLVSGLIPMYDPSKIIPEYRVISEGDDYIATITTHLQQLGIIKDSIVLIGIDMDTNPSDETHKNRFETMKDHGYDELWSNNFTKKNPLTNEVFETNCFFYRNPGKPLIWSFIKSMFGLYETHLVPTQPLIVNAFDTWHHTDLITHKPIVCTFSFEIDP